MTPVADRLQLAANEPVTIVSPRSSYLGKSTASRIQDNSLTFSQRLLETLQRVNECFLHSHEDLYGHVLDAIREELQSPLGIFGYINDDGDLVCPSLTPEVWNQCQMDNKRIVFRVNELGGVLHQVIFEKETVLANDPIPTPSGHVPITRFLGTPILFDDRLIGVIFLANKAEDYTPEDGQFLEHVAKYIGPILESRLRAEREKRQRLEYERQLESQSRLLARRNRQLEYLGKITELGEAGASVEEILTVTARMLTDIFSDSPGACSRIVFRGKVYDSGVFEETEHKIAGAIFVENEYVGGVELCCPIELLRNDDFATHRLFVSEFAERLSSILTRKKMYEDLTAYRQQIEMVLEVTQTGLSVSDEAGHVIYIDPWRRKIYGEPGGKTITEYFGYACSNSSDCAACEALRTKRRVSREAVLPKEGHRSVLTTAIPFHGPDGKWYVSEITIDLTERKRWEDRLVHMQRLEAVNYLAEGLAHELNTPLQYLESNLCFLSELWNEFRQLLENEKWDLQNTESNWTLSPKLKQYLIELIKDKVNSEVSHAFAQSRDGVARMANIVRTLRELAQLQGTELRMCDLHQTIEAAIDVSRYHWSRITTVATDFDRNLPVVPLAQAEFGQVIINILQHIRQTMEQQGMSEKSPGRVTISTRRVDNQWVEVRFSHNAYAFTEQLRKSIFEPFYSPKSPTELADNHLAFVRRVIVQTHHGTVELQPGEPDGSVLVIRLPVTCKQACPDRSPNEHHTGEHVSRMAVG